MSERSILFPDEMVRAILDGRKTQTRVPLRKQPLDILPMNEPNKWIALMSREPNHGLVVDCRYGVPDDQLWVREAWSIDPNDYMPDTDLEWTRQHVAYRADDPEAKPTHWGWRPSTHMPRWASRLSLTIKSVRVERLQDISEVGAQAEGCVLPPQKFSWSECRLWFRAVWDASYKKRYSWDSNPWVWVVGFDAVAPRGRIAGGD